MDIEAFILIGGQSTRFGADKAFFLFEGETLGGRAARVAGMALHAAPVRFVAASAGQFGSRLTDMVGDIVFDRNPGKGAWSALDAALSNSAAEWTLVLACDLPFVSTELLQQLTGGCIDEVDAVIPRQPDGRLQPLCAVYRTGPARSAVEGRISSSERLPPVNMLFEDLKTKIIQVDTNELRNINTPADLY